MNNRIKLQCDVSTALTCMTDQHLASLLADASPGHSGIGGSSCILSVENTPVFVKRIALSMFELQPETTRATANIFGLPLWFQYDIGSPGFGCWRELAAHIITTNWVLSGECSSFPILYHWRIYPVAQSRSLNVDEWGGLENYLKLWQNSPGLLKRVEEINAAPFEIVLFLEYVPHTLLAWLNTELAEGGDAAAQALEFAEKQLRLVNTFMQQNHFVHFDAHFGNVLTDGERVYMGDLGLALSSKFELSAAEIEFLDLHKGSLDQVTASAGLVYSVLCNFNGRENWRDALIRFPTAAKSDLPTHCREIVERYRDVTLALLNFRDELKLAPDSTKYPAEKMERLLGNAVVV